MTGSRSDRSLTRFVAALGVGLIATTVLAATPAGAHHLNNFRKERRHIENRARSVVGTPYRYGGNSPNGFDCSGFTTWAYEGHGASLPRQSTAQFNLPKYSDKYKRIWKRSKLEVGDLVFHDTTSGRVGHVGIYIGGGKFISATSSGGVRVRNIYDPYYWGPRWVGATRLPATMRYGS